MEFVLLKFKTLRWLFSIITSALLASIISETADANFLVAFLVLALGLPLVVWLERVKNIPAHLLSAYMMHKQLVGEQKKKLRNLPLKTVDEWNDFQSFYDDDNAISAHAASDPKAFAVSTRYSIQTMRDCGNFLDFMNCGLVSSRAIEEICREAVDKERSE